MECCLTSWLYLANVPLVCETIWVVEEQPRSMLTLHCIVNGEENPQTAPSHWDFDTLPEENRATAIGNKHRKMVKIARMVPKISWRTYRQTDRQTDRHTDRQTCSSQYFATAPAGEELSYTLVADRLLADSRQQVIRLVYASFTYSTHVV